MGRAKARAGFGAARDGYGWTSVRGTTRNSRRASPWNSVDVTWADRSRLLADRSVARPCDPSRVKTDRSFSVGAPTVQVRLLRDLADGGDSATSLLPKVEVHSDGKTGFAR